MRSSSATSATKNTRKAAGIHAGLRATTTMDAKMAMLPKSESIQTSVWTRSTLVIQKARVMATYAASGQSRLVLGQPPTSNSGSRTAVPATRQGTVHDRSNPTPNGSGTSKGISSRMANAQTDAICMVRTTGRRRAAAPVPEGVC
jgi:hypothetical protein